MKGGFHDELAKELQVTSVSSLGSSSASSYISSLDKNGDGIISADELAAANATSTSTTKSTASTAATGDDSASITQKIAADIAALMLQLQQSATSDDGSDDSSTNGNSPKGILALMDSNGDGKLTTSEFLSADPATVAQTAGSDDDSPLEQVLTDMQTAIRAYETTYGASAAAETGSDDIQSV
jgi:Ca2+-binding EF-hand superfamily protein